MATANAHPLDLVDFNVFDSAEKEYAGEIGAILFEKAPNYTLQPRRSCIAYQTTLTKENRRLLVDWLAAVCLKFKFQDETLFLAINLLDRLC